jgi:hypothetical protein
VVQICEEQLHNSATATHGANQLYLFRIFATIRVR